MSEHVRRGYKHGGRGLLMHVRANQSEQTVLIRSGGLEEVSTKMLSLD